MGGGYYTSRDDLDCNERLGLLDTDFSGRTGSLSLSCDDANDLPLFAACSGQDDKIFISSQGFDSGNWVGAGLAPANWRCAWTWRLGETVVGFGNAHIRLCCIKRL